MSSLDANNVLGVYLPNIYISKITLDSTSVDVPLQVKDPHLKAVKFNESAYTNMLFQEASAQSHPGGITPKVYKIAVLNKWLPIEKLQPTTSQDRDLKIKIEFTVKDKVKAGSILSWFVNDEITKYLRARVVMSTAAEVTQEITLNPNVYFGLNGVFNKGGVIFRDLVLEAWPPKWAKIVGGKCVSGMYCSEWEQLNEEFKSMPQDAMFGAYAAWENAKNIYEHVEKNSSLSKGLDVINVSADSLTKKALNDLKELFKDKDQDYNNALTNTQLINQEIDSDGNTIFSFSLQYDLEIPGVVFPQHLSIFAGTYLDLENLLDDHGISDVKIPPGIVENLGVGRTASEIVINQGSVTKTGHIFRDSSGNIYLGEAHKNPMGQWMKGSNFDPFKYIPVSWDGEGSYEAAYQTDAFKLDLLTMELVSNTKVQDFRYITEIEKLSLSVASVLEYATAGMKMAGGSALVTSTTKNFLAKIPNRPDPYFSKIRLSADKKGQCRFHFDVDYFRLLRDNSAYPNLFSTLAKDDLYDEYISLRSKSAIRKMEIVRRRVKAPRRDGHNLNRLGTPLRPVEYTEDKPPRIIAQGGEHQSGKFRKSIYKEQTTTLLRETFIGGVRHHASDDSESIKRMGTLREFFGSTDLPAYPKPRAFCGIDYDMADRNSGYYQYGVRLEIEDPTTDYLRSKLGALRGVLKTFNEYVKFLSSDPKFHNSYNGRFTSALHANPQTDGFITSAWGATTTLAIFLGNFTAVSEEQIVPMTKVLFDMVDPNTSNMSGVLAVLKIITNITTKFEDMVDDVIVQKRSFTKTSEVDRGKPLMPSSQKQTFITVEHYFDEVFDASVNGNLGYDYVSIKPLQKEDYHDDCGLKIISSQDYGARMEAENKRLSKKHNGMQLDGAVTVDGIKDYKGDPITVFEGAIEKANFLSPSFVYLPTVEGGKNTRKELVVDSMKDSDVEDMVLDILLFRNPESNVKDLAGAPKQDLTNLDQSGLQAIQQVEVTTANPLTGEDSKMGPKQRKTRSKLMTLISSRGCAVGEYKPKKPRKPKKLGKFGSLMASLDDSKQNEDDIREGFSYKDFASLSTSDTNPSDFLKSLISITDLNASKYKETTDVYGFVDETDKKYSHLVEVWDAWASKDPNNDWKNPFDALPRHEIALMIEQSMLKTMSPAELEKRNTPSFINVVKRALFNNKVARIQVFDGYHQYETAGQFSYNMKRESWRDLTEKEAVAATGQPKLCRVVSYSNSLTGVSLKDSIDMPTIDEYFILSPVGSVEEVISDQVPTSIINNLFNIQTTKKKVESYVQTLTKTKSMSSDYMSTNTVFGGPSRKTKPSHDGELAAGTKAQERVYLTNQGAQAGGTTAAPESTGLGGLVGGGGTGGRRDTY